MKKFEYVRENHSLPGKIIIEGLFYGEISDDMIWMPIVSIDISNNLATLLVKEAEDNAFIQYAVKKVQEDITKNKQFHNCIKKIKLLQNAIDSKINKKAENYRSGKLNEFEEDDILNEISALSSYSNHYEKVLNILEKELSGILNTNIIFDEKFTISLKGHPSVEGLHLVAEKNADFDDCQSISIFLINNAGELVQDIGIIKQDAYFGVDTNVHFTNRICASIFDNNPDKDYTYTHFLNIKNKEEVDNSHG